MNSGISSNRRTLLAVFIALLVVCELTAYAINTPRPTEQFFQLYVLGANHMAGNYYPKNETNIQVGEPLMWYLGATNSMGSVQLISIRVKAGNQTINAPGDQQAIDSPAPVVTDFERALLDNETWEVSFNWSVSNATLSYGSVRFSCCTSTTRLIRYPTGQQRKATIFD